MGASFPRGRRGGEAREGQRLLGVAAAAVLHQEDSLLARQALVEVQPPLFAVGVVAVDLAEEARKLKAAQPKPGDPNYIHLPGQNAPPPSESYRLALAPRFALPSLGG